MTFLFLQRYPSFGSLIPGLRHRLVVLLPMATPSSSSSPPLTRDSPSLSATPPAEHQRSRSFSLLQNVPIPFASRTSPLRASTTQTTDAVIPPQTTKSPNATELPAEIVINIETYVSVNRLWALIDKGSLNN